MCAYMYMHVHAGDSGYGDYSDYCKQCGGRKLIRERELFLALSSVGLVLI